MGVATSNRETAWSRPVTMRAIRRVVRQIVDRFDPRKVVLFGSRATGTARAESDVDLLVVTRRPMGENASLRIRQGIDYTFPLDLIVWDEERLNWRIAEGDFFLISAMQGGKVLYEAPHR